MNFKWKPIVPSGFRAPYTYTTGDFVFSSLTVDDIEEDYEAVMSSILHIKSTCVFDFYPSWPSGSMTKSEDLSNLGWHQTEFEFRTSFAYKVRSKATKEYLGCAYIFPSNTAGFEADVYSWVKESKKELHPVLLEAMKKWLEEFWPFKSVNYPIKTKAG